MFSEDQSSIDEGTGWVSESLDGRARETQHSKIQGNLHSSRNTASTSESSRGIKKGEDDLEMVALELNQRKRETLHYDMVDFKKIGLKTHNKPFLAKLRERIDRVGIKLPEVEVRYEHLNVKADKYVGVRAVPTLINSTLNIIESMLSSLKIYKGNKKEVRILKNVSGIIKPGRLTLLLGPPGAGKSTLLLALSGKLANDVQVSGSVTYNGHSMDEFVPQRTSAYISQHDLHVGDMTVRETLDFSARCQGVGHRSDVLAELVRREKLQAITPDQDIEIFMKAATIQGQRSSIVTDYALKLLGLDVCADTMVGDEMRRGISGGEMKRVTTGEMIVGLSTAFFMDDISTGLDSSTTFQIVNSLKHIIQGFGATMVISLLQPAPETFNLFDDVILLSEGQIIYHGPRESILEFFEMMGFRCPLRKGIADFLQEVTSKKDQEQYWYDKRQQYLYIPVEEFTKAFWTFRVGKDLEHALTVSYDKSNCHPAALVRKKYGLSKKELFKACFDREVLLMKRSAFIYIFKAVEISVVALITITVFPRSEMDYKSLQGGQKYICALFFGLVNNMFNGLAEAQITTMKLPVFFKQRDAMFFPAWAYSLPTFITRIPVSLIESSVWVILTYYTIGLTPSFDRFLKQLLLMFVLHQMGLSLFRFLAALGRNQIVTNTLGAFVLLVMYCLGGFILSKEDIHSWWIWGYWTSPLMYAQNAISVNELLSSRWKQTGKILLEAKGMFTDESWYWIGVGALMAYNILYNILYTLALAYLNPLGNRQSSIAGEEANSVNHTSSKEHLYSKNITSKNQRNHESITNETGKKGMVLPFEPLSMAFDDINYFVDWPSEMKQQKELETRLQLLHGVSGSFRPGVLTCLLGVSGAGKTTLMDVLAGRKTAGCIEGSITISGYPKNQGTFARICGYCEQNDIHSPNFTVYESLLFSAWLRLPVDVDDQKRKMFLNEVMDLVELDSLRDSIVGLPGVSGLTKEQRKRLTIAVELVANPSIIFMDEPTSGLDARAAAIVMRTVRNTVDTGRTVVCTIHQPSIDIFESFDELLLLKQGGKLIYAGPLGQQSKDLINYFETINGVPKINHEYNPATWVLEVTSVASENLLEVDFAKIYRESSLFQTNKGVINQLKQPVPGSEDIHFKTNLSLSFWVQLKACLWKQHWSYWRNPQYNAVRFYFTFICALLLASIFWKMGSKVTKEQDLLNAMGSMYCAIIFLGIINATSVQPVVDIERSVFYRERAAGMYSSLPYALGQVFVEIPYALLQSFLYGVIVYSSQGLEWTIAKFMWFQFFMFVTFLYHTYYGMLAVALTPSAPFAAVVASAFFIIWMLFAGFLVPRTSIPIWWRWYYWGCPVAWTFYGLVTSQFGDSTEALLTYGGDEVPLKNFLCTSFGFDHDMLLVAACVLVFFSVLFAFIFAYGIRVLNFQKR